MSLSECDCYKTNGKKITANWTPSSLKSSVRHYTERKYTTFCNLYHETKTSCNALVFHVIVLIIKTEKWSNHREKHWNDWEHHSLKKPSVN